MKLPPRPQAENGDGHENMYFFSNEPVEEGHPKNFDFMKGFDRNKELNLHCPL
jgi:hypothetical protein